ncbi:hypothetical protein MMC26_006582 [Xylographa opegraphella]|nr:hypothetical protein [Xylographa opegraphella]
MDPREGLSIANIVFYIPCLFIAGWVSFLHGFGRQSGWIFMVILALVRIVGSICQIVSESSPSESIDEAWIILSSVGLSPLILAMLGLLARVHASMSPVSPLSPKIFRLLAVVPLVALILAIVGGSDEASTSDPSKVSSGLSLVRAALVIFMVVFLVLAAITLATFLRLRSVSAGEERILYALALSIPFIFVRLIYSLIVDFAGNSRFNLITGDVVIQGCMASLMEYVVVILYLSAGLVAPRIAKSHAQPSIGLQETGYSGQESGRTTSQYAERQFNQPTYDVRYQRRAGEAAPTQQYTETKPQYTPIGRHGRKQRRVQGPTIGIFAFTYQMAKSWEQWATLVLGQYALIAA